MRKHLFLRGRSRTRHDKDAQTALLPRTSIYVRHRYVTCDVDCDEGDGSHLSHPCILRGLHTCILALDWNDEKTRKKHTYSEHSISVELRASIRHASHVTNALPKSTCAFDLRSRDPILADLALSRGTQYTGGSYTPRSRKVFVVGRVSAQKGGERSTDIYGELPRVNRQRLGNK